MFSPNTMKLHSNKTNVLHAIAESDISKGYIRLGVGSITYDEELSDYTTTISDAELTNAWECIQYLADVLNDGIVLISEPGDSWNALDIIQGIPVGKTYALSILAEGFMPLGYVEIDGVAYLGIQTSR